jgi:hypothetical protein
VTPQVGRRASYVGVVLSLLWLGLRGVLQQVDDNLAPLD